ncbi:hypothetical protein [Sphingomonas sp.]|uniref:hypothetical protein n=1 Tax=Sphingomonas sp. TaxID=28214 RepID=UPI001DB613CF|nr:hypothetical protein [Sphingomonas sp.]MBX9795500.1 hypothetical protein [Sphingomonas sp.]
MSLRLAIATVAGSALALCLAVPAFSAPDRAGATAIVAPLAGFTPASADPKLAALLAKTGTGTRAYRFTPAESPRAGNRPVTVAVRARSAFVVQVEPRASQPEAPALGSVAPISYNLGTSLGWQKFALPAEPKPAAGARIALIETSARLPAAAPGAERLHVASEPVSTARLGPTEAGAGLGLIDVGGAYRLSKHVDLTAGVRYRDQRYRVDRGIDSRQDSRAIYIGTALRF